MSVAHRFTWLFGLQSLTELKACSPLALYHCGACHTYLVETVMAPHVGSLKASLLHRQVGFFHGLLASPCKEATVAALLASRDRRRTIGANLALVREVTRLEPWTAGKNELRAALEAAELSPVPPMDKWRIPALEKLLAARLAANYRADQEEVD